LNKSKLITIAKYAWGIVIALAVIYFVFNNYGTAQIYFKQINTKQFAISVTFQIIARIFLIELIRQSVVRVNWNPKYGDFFSLISISQLGKYVPGGVWQFVARFGAYKENNISNKELGKSFLIENIWMVSGAFFTGLFFILINNPEVILNKYGIFLNKQIYIILAIGCLLFCYISIFITEYKLYPASIYKISIRSIRLFTTQTIMWFFLGASFFILFSGMGLDNLSYSIGAYTLSFLAGYVAIFAPGGIGVREVVLVFLFSPFFTPEKIGVYAIIHRLLYTIVEFGFAAIAYALLARKKWVNSAKPSDSNSQ
jgi:uncharacterized membrane protein YbhN (UPF0104 family)